MHFSGSIIFFSTVLTACVWAELATGQNGANTSPETAADVQLFAEVRIDRELSDEMVRFIATQSVRVSLPRVKGRIEDLVREACGYTSPYNERVFAFALTEQGAVIDGDRFELLAEATRVPSCLPDEQRTRLVGRLPLEGDDFYGYFRRDLGVVLSDFDNARPRVPINPGVELDIAGLAANLNYQDIDVALTLSDSSDFASVAVLANDYIVSSGIDPADSSRLAYESWVTTEALVSAGIGQQISREIVGRSLERMGVPDTSVILATVDAARTTEQRKPRIRDLPFMEKTCRFSTGPTAAYCNAPASNKPVTLPSRTSDIITSLNRRDRAPNAATIFATIPVISVEQVQKTATIPIANTAEGKSPKVVGGGPTPCPYVCVPDGAIVRRAQIDDVLLDMSDAPLSVFEDVANDPNDPSKSCKGDSYNYWDDSLFKADFRATLDKAVSAKIAESGTLNQTQLLVLDSGFVDLGTDLIDAAGLGRLYKQDDPMTGESLYGMDEAARRKIDHGTAVTSVAMGGPGMSDVLGGVSTYIKVRTKAAYLHRTEDSKTVFRVFKNLPAIVRDYEPTIVNLSIGARERTLGNLEAFKGAFNESGPLFILSAGNNGNNDDVQGGKTVYAADIAPQIWATAAAPTDGTGAFNVIVVAAQDGTQPSGDLAWFSNFGESQVYLAAPGCNIRAMQSNAEGTAYVEHRYSGTSFAAPIVSFVAALVHSVLPDQRNSNPWVRARLLSTADINLTLRAQRSVNEGRVLNPIAALRVYEDVITLKKPDAVDGALERAGKVVKIGPTFRPVMGDVCLNSYHEDHTALRLFSVPSVGSEADAEWFVDLITRNVFMPPPQLCTLNNEGNIKILVQGTEVDVKISTIADIKFAIRVGE